MLTSERLKELLFPHDGVRKIQDELIISVERCVQKKKHLVVHAPTGLGKTAASLAPAISHAIKEDLTVFFLTPRHTQHKIALDTVKAMEERHGVKIPVTNLIGKKWMCLQPGVEKMYSGEFVDFCKRLREDGACSFYENLKRSGQLSTESRLALEETKKTPGSDKLRVIGQEYKVCPYEIGVLAAKDARVIITDYFYLFHPAIRESFFAKIGKDLSKSIIIVDEAHNLPDRIKDLASERITLRIVERAQQEAAHFEFKLPVLGRLATALSELAKRVDKDDECYISRDELLKILGDVDIDELSECAEKVRAEAKRSYLATITSFLSEWGNEREGFTRILSLAKDTVLLTYRCLDPGIISGPVLRESYSSILMSGTLTPTAMYAELLDVPLNSEEYTFQSPFPDENRMTLIVPQTTTKYQARSEKMYELQAKILSKMVASVPGNSMVFFPSYFLRDRVAQVFNTLCPRTVFMEQPGMSKIERESLLNRFAAYKDSGAVLLAVMAGSFAEGVDFPGDLLKGVFVVGLPLARPNKEAKALIEYYDKKFSRGWDYGYVFPAFNKILQSAGRCIRSETDRGSIVFLDERYAWRTYQRCFPPHWDLRVTLNPSDDLHRFFSPSALISEEKVVSLDDL